MEDTKQVRCPICGRWLFTGHIIVVDIKCPKCKNIVKLYGRPKVMVVILDRNVSVNEVQVSDLSGRIVGRVINIANA